MIEPTARISEADPSTPSLASIFPSANVNVVTLPTASITARIVEFGSLNWISEIDLIAFAIT